MSEQLQQLQIELVQVKAQAFELYQGLEKSSRQIQSLESAFQHIAQISGYTVDPQSGLNGLMQHLEMQFSLLKQTQATPMEAEPQANKPEKVKPRQKVFSVKE